MATYRRLLILLAVFLVLAWFGGYGVWVERGYSTGFYPFLADLLRLLLGWVPFSLGDVMYFIAGVLGLAYMVILVTRAIRREWTFRQWLGGARRLLEWILLVIIVFNLVWALNYNRLGIAYQLKLRPRPYTEQTLQHLIDSLLVRVNRARQGVRMPIAEPRAILKEAREAYRNIGPDTLLSFLDYRFASVKPSLYGKWGNYLGFLGYYNPFTGEAQVNCTVPAFTLPYTTCHEMAHQLGYASESEANFVGYLAAMHSGDPWFRYSAYFDLFTYANGDMYQRDSAAARRNYRALDTLVRSDYQELRHFLKAHRNPVEPYLNKLYDGYLKAHKQESGIESYNEVTGWLIAYEAKYGRL